MGNRNIRRRFTKIIVMFAAFVLVGWIAFHFTVTSGNRRTMNYTIEMVTYNLLTQLNDEFSEMTATSSLIAGSGYMQDFLTEDNAREYYEMAVTVTEFIRNTVYPHIEADSIIAVSANGMFHRFTGGIDNTGVEKIAAEVTGGDVPVYSIVEYGGTRHFCLTTAVYQRGAMAAPPIGHILILSNVERVRRNLAGVSAASGMEAAVILDGVILISSVPELDGRPASELDRLYGSVRLSQVDGTDLYAAAAMTDNALRHNERLFFGVSALALIALLVTIGLLYRVLSVRMVSPMLERADDMQSGLLRTQIDAHFILNTMDCVARLTEEGNYTDAGIAAKNLSTLVKRLHESDEEENIIEELDYLSRYVKIMNIRSGDRYDADLNADEALADYYMPTRVLQPIVENAIEHGFGNKDGDCRLTVTGEIEDGCAVFVISDNGTGLEESKAAALQDTLDAADTWDFDKYELKGVALLNIQKRIRAAYGKKYGLTVASGPGRGFAVTVRVPLIKKEAKTKAERRRDRARQ